ncbi:type VII secretion system-associated protein [Nocardia abscessus]|uniref:Type VII secretion system-associated protein n=1 Tax=Nocardia abscessus TaxID=120957 RepID=A0ABS0CK01_9NOCA|nr:type VII secretion system-associated protein [Nocardia abscessus]MBF6228748.1 type VII secretion system-associated protein [Nocardia abscessus]
MDPSSAVRRGDWFVLFDPHWSGDPTQRTPPVEVMVGGWRLEQDGELGPFRPNPSYLPQTPHTPSDPIDALLRLIAAGESRSDEIIPTLTRTVVAIACDDQNQPRIAFSPDERPCVVVVTAEIHKQYLPVPRWIPVLGSLLPEVVPSHTDVLFNPSSDHSFRLANNAIRPAGQA